ncbi:hypothetical protein PENSUB_11094 [Penicillium subrubescens]|uniref:Uncharacterized protein n=1 Tax=Penicillium subrubescens TaxID=1316194 RepID=A0A1Q5T5T8_9EURO|nr:hypothetical protein PENSUB_11094 [Penicillium subrubescens]
MAVLLEGRKALHWLNSILISLMVSMLGLLETGTPISCFPSYGTGNMQSSSKGYDTCLGPKQLEALKAIYAGPMDKRTNTTVYPGFSLGSERELLAQETLLYKAYAAPLLQNLIFHNLSYDIDTFSFERDVAQVDAIAGPLIDEIGVDLGAFQRRGGKMVVTQETDIESGRQDHEALPNGLHADQASDENVCGDANYSSEASFAFEEMLGCLKDLRGRYEIPDKFIEMLRRAQN